MTRHLIHLSLAVSLCLATAAGPAGAAETQSWFTVMGDPLDARANTIEVNPAPLSIDGEKRTMKVRVNRSTLRRNWDGLPYRSYESVVLFDCVENSARYVSADFYLQPGWKGGATSAAYSRETPRMMEFRDVTPNPTLRIMRAACSTGRSSGG